MHISLRESNYTATIKDLKSKELRKINKFKSPYENLQVTNKGMLYLRAEQD
jgi:hypothetical protein